MRLATPQEISKIEKKTIEDFGISAEVLMENAGLLSAKEVSVLFLPEILRGKMAIVCGPGNNGGDGLVMARHLHELGVKSLDVIAVGQPSSVLRKLQEDRARKQGISIKSFSTGSDLDGFDIYIDALFGVGLSRTLTSPFSEVVNKINALGKPIVALDLPSGIDGLTGEPFGCAVKAQWTFTMGLAKPGLYTSKGSEFAGRVRVLPIGFPRAVVDEEAHSHFLVNETWAKKFLPLRKKDSHKFQNGHLVVRAGTPGKWGAAALVCQGAYRVGTGYVTLLTENVEDSKKYLGKDLGPEVLISHLGQKNILDRAQAVVVGPGAGVSQSTEDFISYLASKKFPNVVVDADGLTMLAQKKIKCPVSWVLTPHAGELARLLETKSEDIEANREGLALKAAQTYGCAVLLKGHRSLLVTPDGKVFFIASGNAALAKAGTGDVLSGFIGGFMAQGVSPLEAAVLGAYIHGSIADQWIKSGGHMATLNASDLPRLVSDELNRLSSHS